MVTGAIAIAAMVTPRYAYFGLRARESLKRFCCSSVFQKLDGCMRRTSVEPVRAPAIASWKRPMFCCWWGLRGEVGAQWQWNLSEIIDCLPNVACLCVGRGLLGEVNHQIIEHAPGAGSTRVFAELQTHARPPHHRVPVAPRCHILSINSVEFCKEGNGCFKQYPIWCW